MNNIYDHAVPIPLPVHQDPQCFVLLQYIRDEIWMYFRIWNNEFKEDTKFIGCLHFSGVWAVKTERFTKFKFYPNVDEHEYLGYYLEVPSSKWLKELYDKREEVEGANWRDYDFREYKHYVVESNKNWVEIIASDVEFSKVLSKNHREKVRFFRNI